MRALPLIIAICGGSGAGKSTFVSSLLDKMRDRRVAAITEDSYYVSPPDRFAENPALFNFDTPDAKDHALLLTHLQCLKAGQSIDVPVYDFRRHCRTGESVRIADREIVLLDGIHLLCDQSLRAFYDWSIYLDVPDDIRLIRRLRRDRVERGRGFDEIVAQYLASVRPMHYRHTNPAKGFADEIIGDGALERDFEAAVSRVCARIVALCDLAGLRIG